MIRTPEGGKKKPKVLSNEEVKTQNPWDSEALKDIRKKRALSENMDTDQESCTSGASGASKKSKITDNTPVNRGENTLALLEPEVLALKEQSETEIELESGMSGLKCSLINIKLAATELANMMKEMPINSSKTFASWINCLKAHTSLALETHRKMELLRQIDKLTLREVGTQITPTRIQSEVTGRGVDSSNYNNRNKNRNLNKGGGKESAFTSSSGEGIVLSQEEWTEINRKKDRENRKLASKIRKLEISKKATAEIVNDNRETRIKKKKEPPPPKTEAILIKATEGKTYAGILKNLRDNAGVALEGVETVRRSRGGDVIIEISKKTDIEVVENKIRNSMGPNEKIRSLKPKIALEIDNIDPTVDKEELTGAIKGKLSIEEKDINIKSMKTTFSGNLRAIIEIPANTMEDWKDIGKIRLGYTNCSIRKAIEITRCYRCHALGHLSYNCKEISKETEICRKCGEQGHLIQNCNADSRCRLCLKEGISPSKVQHVAGALSCPQYKLYIQGKRRNQLANSS